MSGGVRGIVGVWMGIGLGCVLWGGLTGVIPSLTGRADVATGGRVYPAVVLDDDDEDCPTDEEASQLPMDADAPARPDEVPCPGLEECPPGHDEPDCGGWGMPVWRVSEPFINLWVKDVPLFYPMSSGRMLTFVLRYKQRGSPHATNVFGVGRSWECSWLSYFETAPDGQVRLRVPGGGSRRYGSTGWEERRGTRGEWVGTTWSDQGPVNYRVAYRSQSVNHYDRPAISPEGSLLHLLSEMRDRQGRALRFEYVTNASRILLSRVVDFDGRVVTLSYQDRRHPRYITAVRDPYGREARLRYDTNGNLVEIVDVAGLTNRLAYEPNGFLSALTTPYGTTRFESRQTDSGDPDAPVFRTIKVTPPDGAAEVYAFHEVLAVDRVPDYYGDMPRVEEEIPEAVTAGPLNVRSSFHWGRRAWAQVKGPWPVLTAADYLGARWRHWNVEYSRGRPSLDTRLLFERAPSPDGLQAGHRVWYAYPYDASQDVVSVWPSLRAERLPDGVVRYRQWLRNEWGLPDQTAETYAAGSEVAARTVTYRYDATGRNLLEAAGPLVDETGQPRVLRQYAYNSWNQLVAFTNAVGEVTRWQYDPASRNLAQLTYATGLRMSNTLAGGFVSRRTWWMPDGSVLATNLFSYDRAKVRVHGDARGARVTHYWDPLGRPLGSVYPDGTTTSNLYRKLDGQAFPQATGQLDLLDRTRAKDRLGRWTAFVYDAQRRLIAMTNTAGGTTRYVWCDCGSPEAVTDPAGNTTRHDHDQVGRLVAIHEPDGRSIRVDWNSLDQVVGIADAAGAVAMAYNHQGRRTRIATAAGVVGEAEYDILDRPVQVRQPQGPAWSQTFDALGRVAGRVELHSGETEGFGYSPGIPWPATVTNKATGGVQRFRYDAAGRLVEAVAGTQPATLFTPLATNRFAYTGAGDLRGFTDAAGRTTRWEHDAEGRTLRKTDATGQTCWTNGFNVLGWLEARWTPGRPNPTRFHYDLAGRMTRVDYAAPELPDVEFAYDTTGRLRQMTDGVGVTQFTWSPTGRLASEDGPWDADAVRWAHDEGGLLRRMSLDRPNASAWAWDYTYDTSRRLTAVGSPAGVFGYRYDGTTRQVRAQTGPWGGATKRETDPAGRVVQMTLMGPDGRVLAAHTQQYDAAHRLVGVQETAGNQRQYHYDAFGQLTRVQGTEPGGQTRLQEDQSWTFDLVGNLVRRSQNTSTLQQTTDVLNRAVNLVRGATLVVSGMTGPAATLVTVNGLKAALYQDGTFARAGVLAGPRTVLLQAVAHDVAGARQTNTVNVSLPGTVACQYDARGNLISDGRRWFTYDERDLLTRVRVTNGVGDSVLTEFQYDGLGRRRVTRAHVWRGNRWELRADTRTVYAGRLPLEERNEWNLPQVTYTRGLDRLGRWQAAGGIGSLLGVARHGGLRPEHYHVHADAGGNLIALLDAQGEAVARYQYDPYGRLLAGGGDVAFWNGARYQGKTMIEGTGLYDFGRRFYDPTLQRWLTREPLGELGDPHAYRYCGNDPVNRFDADGRSWLDWFLGEGYDGPSYMAPDGTLLPGPPAALASDELLDFADQIAPEDLVTAASGRAGSWGEAARTAQRFRDELGRELLIQGAACALPLLASELAFARSAGRCSPRGGASPGISILGHYPDYLEAAKLGGKVFDVPEHVWRGMSAAQRWAANRKFLDRARARGDAFFLATRWADHRPQSWFAQEVEYLLQQGYNLSADGHWLIPGKP